MKNALTLIILFLLFGACQKDEILPPVEKQQEKISLVDNYLKFNSPEALQQIMDNLNNGNMILDDIPEVRAIKGLNTLKTGVDDETQEYELDTLVPNEKFRALLNDEREIQVGDIFYKITPAGTYYCDEALKDELRKYIDQLSVTGQSKSTSLKTLKIAAREEGINDEEINGRFYLRRTFEESRVEINEGGGYGGRYSGGYSEYTSETLPPNFDNLSQTQFDAKTWVGKGIQAIVGRNVGHGRYWGSKRRVKVNFYNYDYVAYRESGIRAKFQKKNWIGWSDTRAPQLMIGWRNIMYSYKYRNGLREYHDWEKEQTNTIDKIVNNKKWAIIRTRNQKAVDKILEKFYASTADGIARKGLVLGVDQLKNLIRNELNKFVAPQANKILLQLYDEANHKVYYIVSDNIKKDKNVKNLVHVFDKDDGFILNWSSTSEAWRDYSNWGIERPASLKIESGSTFGIACYDKEWKGYEIIKK